MSLPLKILLPYYLASICVMVLFVILRVTKHLPIFHHLIPKLMKNMSTIDMQRETYWDSMFTWNMYRAITNGILNELRKKVSLLSEAQNSALMTIDGHRLRNIFDMVRGSRPLVLNFGSRSCPIFMERMAEFTQMVKDFSDVADFLIVYIEEAHPSDGWAFKNNIDIVQHRTLEERCAAAKLLQQSVDLPCPLVVDTMKNEATISYAALPIRFYVIQEGRVIYAGGTGPTHYSPSQVRSYLERWKATLSDLGRMKPKRGFFSRAG